MLARGQVVEYIADNRFVTAVCLDLKKDKPRLLTETNREAVIPARRLIGPPGQNLDPAAPRESLVGRLKEISAERDRLKNDIDLAEVWSVVVEDSADQTLDPAFVTGLLFGEPVEPDQVAAVIRAAIDNKTYFRYKPDGLLVTSQEKVEQLEVQRAREAELAAELEAVGSWLAAARRGDRTAEPEGGQEVIDRLIDVAVNGPDSPHFSRVKAYLEAAAITGRDGAFQALVGLGRFSPDEDLDILRLDLPTVFPDSALAEADELVKPGPPRVDDGPARLDLTDLPTMTIDGPDTKDFDDALTFAREGDGYLIWIHIADAAALIKPDTELDMEARARVSSLYLPDRRLPMLPPGLSEDLLSLVEGQVRPAVSLMVRLSAEGAVREHRAHRSLVRVDRRLTYDQADNLIQTESDLAELHRLAGRLQDRRRANGAMVLEAPEVMVWPDNNGRVELARWEQPGPARMTVAELMVLANRLVAQNLAEAGIPTFFRSQEPSKNNFEPPPDSDPLWVVLRKRMLFNRLEITTCPAPHAGMGLAAYTTWTSPIRRYMDLVTIRQLTALIQGRMPVYNEFQVEDLCQAVTPLIRAHNQLRFRRHRYWLLKYMAQFPDRVWEGVVLDRIRGGFSLVLLETMLRAAAPRQDQPGLTPGQRIGVRIEKIDPRDDILRLEMA